MLRLDWRVVGTFAIILALACAAVLLAPSIDDAPLSSSAKISIENYCDAAKKRGELSIPKECKNVWTLTLEDPVALYTAVLTAATIILGVATCGLWWMAIRQSEDTRASIHASREANKIASQTFEINQRPWLALNFTGLGRVRLHTNMLALELPIDIQNHGSSPALTVRYLPVLTFGVSGENVWEKLEGLSTRIMALGDGTRFKSISIYPTGQRRLVEFRTHSFSREEIDRGRATVFLNLYNIVTYRHPTTNRMYCSASGYGFMFTNIPTYAQNELVLDPSSWSAHPMPGCNYVI